MEILSNRSPHVRFGTFSLSSTLVCLPVAFTPHPVFPPLAFLHSWEGEKFFRNVVHTYDLKDFTLPSLVFLPVAFLDQSGEGFKFFRNVVHTDVLEHFYSPSLVEEVGGRMGRLDFNLAAFPTRLPRVEILPKRSPHLRFERFHSPPTLVCLPVAFTPHPVFPPLAFLY